MYNIKTYTTMYDGVGPRRGKLAVGATRGVAEIRLKRVEVRRERAADQEHNLGLIAHSRSPVEIARWSVVPRISSS
jgi:hypothetical protein